jgi:hypothetical protein
MKLAAVAAPSHSSSPTAPSMMGGDDVSTACSSNTESAGADVDAENIAATDANPIAIPSIGDDRNRSHK